MILVNPNTTEKKTNKIVGKQVSPMAAVEERAQKKLKEEMRENISHVLVDSIKAENNQKSCRSLSVRKNKATKITSKITSRKRKIDNLDLNSNIFTFKRARKVLF